MGRAYRKVPLRSRKATEPACHSIKVGPCLCATPLAVVNFPSESRVASAALRASHGSKGAQTSYRTP